MGGKQTYRVRELFKGLAEDEWRRENPYSSDIETVDAVLFHPYADDVNRQEALAAWFQRYQPCLFGRVAAAVNRLHYIFLYEEDLVASDQHIAESIRLGVQAWRQRSVSPRSRISAPAHGLVLSV